MDEPAATVGRVGRVFAWAGGVLFVVSLLYFVYAYVVRFGAATASQADTGGTARAWLADVALFAVFALHHSLMARTGMKRALTASLPPALERSVYVWVASLLFVLTCWAWQPIPGVLYAIPPPWHLAGWAAQAFGVWLTLDAARAMDVLELAGIRQVYGSPRAVALKASGAYGIVRHPIYLGWVLVTFGIPVMTGTRFAFAIVSACYLVIAIPFEERTLRETLGEAYAAYARRVRWRIVPGLY
jgi:protein-S-isoprenylcysteine O-methyltransferase Ste14